LPSLSKHFNISTDVGLAAVLSGTASDEAAIVKLSLRNLDLIVAGAVPADFNPELLADGVFLACLARWRAKYDLILLDSPPVLPVADSRILATQADGAVMVLRASHTKRPDVIRAYADLSASGGTLLGSVLVGVPAGREYGYGGYGSYGGYAAALTGDQTAWTPKE
jgi:Mrp family chromosome partitioning ATPase